MGEGGGEGGEGNRTTQNLVATPLQQYDLSAHAADTELLCTVNCHYRKSQVQQQSAIMTQSVVTDLSSFSSSCVRRSRDGDASIHIAPATLAWRAASNLISLLTHTHTHSRTVQHAQATIINMLTPDRRSATRRRRQSPSTSLALVNSTCSRPQREDTSWCPWATPAT